MIYIATKFKTYISECNESG